MLFSLCIHKQRCTIVPHHIGRFCRIYVDNNQLVIHKSAHLRCLQSCWQIASSVCAVDSFGISGERIFRGVHTIDGSIASGARVNSGVCDVGGIACNVRDVSAVRYFCNGIAGGDDSVVDGGVIAIDSCIVGGVPDSDSSGLNIGGLNVSALIVSLGDDGLSDGAAFAFVSLPPHILWL